MTDTKTPAEPTDSVRAAVVELVKVVKGLGREDLSRRATAAGARLKRPATIVCVVGEFKQGKSSLVNGLLGQDACPVDDDLATSSITLVRYGEEAGAVVRRHEDGEAVAERVAIDELDNWVSEVGNPGNTKNVERVEVTVPASILKQGLVIADTPGMGGLGGGHAAATLAFLPFADGLMLVSDASAELSAPELEFLNRAVDLCPTVLFVQTKIDLYPAWERIFELNRGHLAQAGLSIPMVAISSTLRTEALAKRNRDLNERSQYPELISHLAKDVVQPAKEQAAERSARDVRGIVGMVRSGLEDERKIVLNPDALKGSIAEIEAAKARLEHLRGPGARWNVMVGDQVSDLSSRVMHEFRGGMRTVSRAMDERIEALKKGSEWDDMARDLQTDVAVEVTRALVSISDAQESIRTDVADLLQEEDLALRATGGGDTEGVDVSSLWHQEDIDTKRTAGGMFKLGVTGFRGAQGGVMMFGMMGKFLPAAAAGIMVTNPVMLGAGAIFGSIQLLEDRKRKVAMRRQNARQQVRKFVDDVQFEVGNEITGTIRAMQRELRDEFTELLKELQQTYTSTAQRAQTAAKQTQEERKTRAEEIDGLLGQLAAVEAKAQVGSKI
jgi:hypothetical protein